MMIIILKLKLVEYALANIDKLNVMQRYMYDIIMNNVNEVQHGSMSQCRAYFLDAWSGKTACNETRLTGKQLIV